MNRFALLTLYRSFARHRLHAALNIGGLAVGIAVALVLGLYVRFETSYETWSPHHDQVYVVRTALHLPGSPFNGAYSGTMGGLLEQLREEFPGVAGARLRGGKGGGSVRRGGQATTEDVGQVDPSFPALFGLPMVRGDGGALGDPAATLISRSAARRYFGTSDPIGQTMTIAVDGPATYRVAGIFADLPPNSDMRFEILIPMPRTPPPALWNWYRWGTVAVSTWLRFATPADARAFERRLPALVDRRAVKEMGPQPSRILSLSLLPIRRLHLEPEGAESAGRKMTVVTLGLVGVLTLLIAIVNYVNLATARAGLRAREVAMRKVLGADRAMLIRQFLGEAILTVAIAALAGLILAELGLPFVNAVGGLLLAIPYALVVPALAATALLVGAAAGVYPALLLSRFPAAAVLASARAPGGGRAGARLRAALVVFQFAIAIAFIIGTMVLAAQTRHVRHADPGFRRDGMLIIPSFANIDLAREQIRALMSAFRRMPGVLSVAASTTAAGGGGEPNIDAIAMPGRPAPGVTVMAIGTGPDFFRTYAPRLLAGRLFDDAHAADDSSDWRKWKLGRNIVINRKAVAALGFRSPEAAVGRTVGGDAPRTIIGVIDGLRFFGPRAPDDAIYYQYYPDIPPTPVVSVRFAGDPARLIPAIRATWQRLAPQVPLVVETADRRLAQFSEADERAGRLFAIGAVLAIAIACVGLWGLASFTMARRMREIGIRKTLGASSADIVRLLVGQFLRPVLIANLFAWPIAFMAMRAWLAGFGDRIALSPLYFVAATMLATTIAVATVAGQSLRAGRAAPAAALRHD